MNRLSQFATDIAAAFRRLVRPKPVRAPRPTPPPEPKTLILAWSTEEAKLYAKVYGLSNWVAPREAVQLYGYRGVRIVKLNGWMHKLGRDPEFMRALARLEATNHL